ncbi:MAG: M23 family metallopeptidase [Actinobacteria bacterium]|nr:M23 family metallopeptidase [Actinomycetota bacterium]NIS29927.1 M23 family metallopeptidase [Actinomycetota bacterium]NIT94771.1 M23 family metallopeptidase [Actinomycetota bacterium]NIU18430.1 M23 family metallopeptidase [Actinomycetota bacterium]NIU65209.1 M23 family metallopeptidase [Actinomycetota bacterium]
MPTSGSIGSGFGLRVHPIFGSTRMHAGVDIGGTTGTPIWAAKEGRVIFVGSKGGYGNTVIVQHEGNVATLYAHMSAFESSEGDWVDQGEVIGLVGSTGWSTGPHLHFETRIDGVPKDPELFLPA